ncbi:MAG: hypothetical protein KKA60_00735 [Proteobacteria bacterium]|nr:hypothetical protein [Pseudomonadota bacterium]
MGKPRRRVFRISVVLFSTLLWFAASAETALAGPGDINGDGTLALSDAVMALQVSAGLTPSGTVHGEADANGDGAIGMADALAVLQSLLGTRCLSDCPLSLVALGADNAMPMGLLTVNGYGFEGQLSVLFSDGDRFSANIPVIDATANTLLVAVPPFVDTESGSIGSGTVSVRVIRYTAQGAEASNAVEGLRIAGIPVPVTPPGALSLAFLQANIAVAATLGNDIQGSSLDTPALNDALANQAMALATILEKLQDVADNPGHTYEIGQIGDDPVIVRQADLELSDRMVLGLLLALSGETPNLAKTSTPGKLPADTKTESSGGCVGTQAASLAQAAMNNPNAQLIPLAQELVYAPRLNIGCQIAYAIKTTLQVIGGSAALAGGLLGAAGVETMALLRSGAAVLSVTAETSLGEMAVGGALSQTTEGAKQMVQDGMDTLNDFIYLPLKGLSHEWFPFLTNLAIAGLGAYSLDKAFTNAPPRGDGRDYSVNIGTSGTGAGATALVPPGPHFAPETVVVPYAGPDSSSIFSGWTGCDASENGLCFLLMNADKTVSALFDPSSTTTTSTSTTTSTTTTTTTTTSSTSTTPTTSIPTTTTTTTIYECDTWHCYNDCWNAYLQCYDNCPSEPASAAGQCMSVCDHVYWNCPSYTDPETCECTQY